MSQKKWNIILFGGGIFLFVVGIAFGIAWPYLLDLILNAFLQLKPGSEMYKMWSEPPVPIYLDVYMFNWTNSEEFRANKSVTPEFKEFGPFTFEEVHRRVNLDWDYDHDLLTFNQTRTWTFRPDMSQDLSLKITTLSPLSTTVAYYTRNWDSNLWKNVANTLVNKYEDLFLTAPVNEWLFDGIHDDLLDMLDVVRTVAEVPIPYKRFGWLYDRNTSSSYDGSFTIRTGADSLYNTGLLEKWNYESSTHNLTHYEGECAIIKGNTGEVMPALEGFENTTTLFSPDICSTVTLNYLGSTTVEGVEGYEYTADEYIFDNGTLSPDSECYCVDECMPTGVRNISSCKFGAPAFVSMPHFRLADPIFSENIIGMEPDENKHKFYVKFQPDLGVPLDVQAVLQVNLLLRPYPPVGMFDDAPELLIPLFWMAQRAKLSHKLAVLVKIVLKAKAIGMGIFFAIGGIGFLMVFVRFIIIIRNHNKKKSQTV